MQREEMPSSSSQKKPRLRKSAPTIRERAEAQATASEAKPSRIAKTAARAARPLKRVKIPAERFPKPLRTAVKFILRALRWLVPNYFVESWREVRQVTWPARRETWRLTTAVFIFAIVFGALVAGVDKILDAIFKNFVLK
jgi:preprotein translocase SecE subunit